MSKSNIRNFPDKEESSSRKKVQQELIKRIKVRIYTISIILILVAAGVISLLVYERVKVYNTLEVGASVFYETASGSKTVEFAGSVMTYSKDGAGAIDAKGNLLWNITFDMQNPMMSHCGNTVAFADYGGSRIYVEGADAKGYEINTAMPIRKITTSDNGVVAAVLEDVDVTWIYLYGSNGEIIASFRTTMEKSGYPVDISISPSGEVVGVSYYFLDISDVKSSVAFYNFGEVGKNNIDNYVSGYNYKDSLVPYMKFTSNERAFAVSSQRLSIYEGAHKPVNLKDVFINDSITAVYSNDDYIGIVLENAESEDKYRLEIYSTKGELVTKKTFNFEYKDVVFGSDFFTIYGNREVLVSTYKGAIKLDREYDNSIRLIIPTGVPTKYIIVTDTSIDTVTMR